MPSNYPTLKDISAEAGVSMALASVVLNGKTSRIKASAETRQRILDAAANLGYEPDRNARALRMSRSFLIGVIAYDITSSFIPKILAGIQRGFMHTNYGVLPVSYSSEEEFAECMEMFRRRKVDGLIIISTAFREFPEKLAMWNRIAKVFVGCSPELPFSSSVSSDGFVIGKCAAEAFIARKRQNFLHLTYSSSGNSAGWAHALDAAAVPEANRFTVQTRLEVEECTRNSLDIFTAHPEIDAVFADSDLMAAAAIKAAAILGRKIPEDMDIIGVDDSPFCELVTPTLSSVEQPKSSQGEAAAGLMLNMLNGGNSEKIVLPVRLIARDSIRSI